MLVVGNINGNEHLRIIQNIMSLTDTQLYSIPAFKRRESLAFISGSDWPYPIHGWIPEVEIENYTTANPVKAPIDITPWHSLAEIPQPKAAFHDESTDAVTPEKQQPETSKATTIRSDSEKLVYDCITYPFDKVRDRVKRLGLSIRIYESAKNEAVQNGHLIPSSSGKTLYLIPSKIVYEQFGILFPYERSVSVEHGFYVQLAAHVLKKTSSLKVQIETPVGTKGATIDIATVDESGEMAAYEITLSTSNLLSNAAKLQDTAYTKIVWLCRDEKTAKAVKAFFNKSTSLPSELTAKFEYLSVSKWISQNR
jgi:hypothetical protein